MYKYFFMLLAITGAACASTQPADRAAGNVQVANDRYDQRDSTIEVIGEAQNARPALETRILKLVNQERQSAGIRPLSFSPQLAKAATYHSSTMATNKFFEHRGAGEAPLYDRVTASGLETDHVGENIFETSESANAAVAEECVQMWMQSEGHRLNMMSPEFEKTGIAIQTSDNGENYITEDFAH